MPKDISTRRTDYRDAAAILRGLENRISGLERTGTGEDRPVQLQRQIEESFNVDDDEAEGEELDAEFIWNVSRYNLAQWGGIDVARQELTVPIETSLTFDVTIPAVLEEFDTTAFLTPDLSETITEPGVVSESFSQTATLTPLLNDTAEFNTNEQFSSTIETSFFFLEQIDQGGDVEDIPSGAVNLNDEGMDEGDTIQDWWNEGTDMSIDPGVYEWDGSGRSFNGYSLWGKGQAGDVELEIQPGSTIDGSAADGGGLVNIRLTGVPADDTKSGWDVEDGARFRRYVNLAGLHDEEARHFYHPDAPDPRPLIVQSAWANAVNNGAYTDKGPMEFRHCAAWDNNVSNIRVGNRETSSSLRGDIIDTVVGCLINVESDGETSENCRGIRIRHPAPIHLTRVLIHYRDVSGAGRPIQFHSGADGGEMHFDHVVIWNDTNNDAVNDGAGGTDMFIDGPTIVGGPGDLDFQGDIIDPDDNLTFDSGLDEPEWDWDAVTYGQQSPVAPYFDDVGGNPNPSGTSAPFP